MELLLMMTMLQALEIMTTMEKDQLLLMTLMELHQLMIVMLLQLLLMNPMVPLLKNLMALQLMRLMVPQLMMTTMLMRDKLIMIMRDLLLLLMTPMVLQLLKNMELQLVMNMVPQLMKLLLNILLMPDVGVPDLETTVVQLLELTETGQLLEDQPEDVQLKLKEQADNSDQHKTEDLSNNNVVLSLNNSQDVDVVEVLSPSQFLTEVH